MVAVEDVRAALAEVREEGSRAAEAALAAADAAWAAKVGSNLCISIRSVSLIQYISTWKWLAGFEVFPGNAVPVSHRVSTLFWPNVLLHSWCA